MIATALAAIGVAILLVPRRQVRDESGRDGAPARRGEPRAGLLATRHAGLVAAVLAGLATMALFGPIRGVFAAACVAPLVGVGVRGLQRRPVPRTPDRSLAVTLDLCAAALRAGRTPADALSAAAASAESGTAAALTRVAGLLRLGADPVRAWAVLEANGPLGQLAATAARSAVSGIRSATAFERLADDIRAESTARATARAQRAGVQAIAPLAVCFLPSFLCLGIVPVVVGVAESALGTMR